MLSTSQSDLTEPIPFDPVQFLDAKRVTGLVLVPEAGGVDEGALNSKDCDPLDLQFNASMDTSFAASGPPALQRKSSLNGNILWIHNHQKAFFLQRKIGNISSNNGSVRVGFELQQSPAYTGTAAEDGNEDEPYDTMGTEYDVIRSDGPYSFQMVAIKVQTRDAVMGKEGNTRCSAISNDVVASAKVELAAMQMIANHYGDAGGANASHVDYCHYICLDRSTIYAIGPFYGDGSLFQYVVESGTLSEPIARHFFKQILTGLESLRDVGMCHRNLSLENVHLRGTSHCALTDLGSCLRMPPSSANATLPPHMVVGGNPRYIPPEVVRTEPSFDGYAADLWASGIILCGMLFGTEAPFVWASPQDRRYMEICVKGNLKGLVASRKFSGSSVVISDDGIDLIQDMLRSIPSERLTLEQTMQHPWLQGETAIPEFSAPVMRKREG